MIAASQSIYTSMSGVLKAQSFRLVWCAAAVSIVTCADPNSERKGKDVDAVTALVVDRAPVMGGRIVVALDEAHDHHPVRLLPPSARDRRRHIFTLALGARTHPLLHKKTLRLRVSSKRGYRQWTSAITSAITSGMNTKACDSTCVDVKSEVSTTTKDDDDDDQVSGQLDMLSLSLRLSQCETATTSSLASMTPPSSCCSQTSLTSEAIDQEVADEDDEEVAATACAEIDNATGTESTSSSSTSVTVKNITSAVASCEASESWCGSPVAARHQLACHAIRQIPRVSQWDVPAVIGTMRLEAAACDIVVDHSHQLQQQQQTINASAVCEELLTSLDVSVYILTTPSSALKSTTASVSIAALSESKPSAEFYAYDVKQRVLRSRSAVEWLSALTGELVTARRSPVILHVRGLDLSGCSLLRFADVVSASPLPVDGGCVAAGNDDDDDDSDGGWV